MERQKKKKKKEIKSHLPLSAYSMITHTHPHTHTTVTIPDMPDWRTVSQKLSLQIYTRCLQYLTVKASNVSAHSFERPLRDAVNLTATRWYCMSDNAADPVPVFLRCTSSRWHAGLTVRHGVTVKSEGTNFFLLNITKNSLPNVWEIRYMCPALFAGRLLHL